MAYKVFTNGSVLNASEINDNLMNQAIAVFSNSAARSAAITSPVEGQVTYLEDTAAYESYDGSSWIAFGGGGKILQVVSATNNTQATTSSTSYQTTGLTATITPSSATNKVLILAESVGESPSNTTGGTWTLYRGTTAGTDLAGDPDGISQLYSAGGSLRGKVSGSILDSPNTTSAQTYTFAFKSLGGGGTITTQLQNTLATIILMEVAA